MSLFNTIRTIAIAGLALSLAGCGFSPLYGKRSVDQIAAESQLALIRIETIKDRVGQQLHNGLLDRLTPKGPAADPAYVLLTKITESISSLGVQKSAVATRANLRLDVSYLLRSAGNPTADALTSGTVLAISGYDISNAEYTTLVASQNARASAVREVADDIRTRLAVYFRRQKSGGK
ncbi:MAG: LPS assembly lipoprotein LptE [Alphaproteobacteria bacterium]